MPNLWSDKLNNLIEAGRAVENDYDPHESIIKILENNTVYLKSDMSADADGSPRATAIDPDGQSETSLRRENGWRGEGDYVNAEKIPYFVLPGNFKTVTNIRCKLGDMALVRYRDREVFAIYADSGPNSLLGNAADELNYFIAVSSLVNSYHEKKEDDKAASTLNKAIETVPKAEFYAMRGQFYRLKLKVIEKAIQDYSKAVELDSKKVEYYQELSNSYVEIKNYQSALDTLNKAIDANPTSALAYYQRANLYRLYLKNFAQAIADYQKGIEVAPNSDLYKKLNVDALADIEKDKAREAEYVAAQKAKKAEKRKENLNAVLGAVQTITQAVTKTSSQQNTSGGQTSSTNSTNGSTNQNSNSGGGSGSTNPNIVVPRNLGTPYPNTGNSMEKEVNKLVAIADTAKTCQDGQAFANLITSIVNSGGSVPLAMAKSHVDKSTAAIAELVRILGCK